MDLLDLLHYIHVPLVLGGPEVYILFQLCSHQHWAEEVRITSLHLLKVLCLIQPRLLLASFTTGAHCWLFAQLGAYQDPQVFYCKTTFWPRKHSCDFILDFFLPMYKNLHFSSLTFLRLLSSHLSSLLRSFWQQGESTLPNFGSSENVLRVHSTLLSRSLMEISGSDPV